MREYVKAGQKIILENKEVVITEKGDYFKEDGSLVTGRKSKSKSRASVKQNERTSRPARPTKRKVSEKRVAPKAKSRVKDADLEKREMVREAMKAKKTAYLEAKAKKVEETKLEEKVVIPTPAIVASAPAKSLVKDGWF